MTSMLAPVIGVLAAWIQLNEVPNSMELIGMLLISLALVQISIITMRKHKPVDCAEGQEL
jgi:drug/metabolite transporter (DMT)-like permease